MLPGPPRYPKQGPVRSYSGVKAIWAVWRLKVGPHVGHSVVWLQAELDVFGPERD